MPASRKHSGKAPAMSSTPQTIVLIDFDGTIECLATLPKPEKKAPAVTKDVQRLDTKPSNTKLQYNLAMIEAGRAAQKAGCLVLGFTSFSARNYSKGYYKGSPGRRRIVTDLKNNYNFEFDAVVVSSSYLATYEILKTEAAKVGLPIEAYIKTLGDKTKLTILNSFFQNTLMKLEADYDQDPNDPKANHEIKQKAMEAEEERLKRLIDEAKKDGFKSAPISSAKEGMFEIVMALFGDAEYVLFDDKGAVCDHATQLKKDGVNISHLKVKIAKRDVTHDTPEILDPSVLKYEDVILKPAKAQAIKPLLFAYRDLQDITTTDENEESRSDAIEAKVKPTGTQHHLRLKKKLQKIIDAGEICQLFMADGVMKNRAKTLIAELSVFVNFVQTFDFMPRNAAGIRSTNNPDLAVVTTVESALIDTLTLMMRNSPALVEPLSDINARLQQDLALCQFLGKVNTGYLASNLADMENPYSQYVLFLAAELENMRPNAAQFTESLALAKKLAMAIDVLSTNGLISFKSKAHEQQVSITTEKLTLDISTPNKKGNSFFDGKDKPLTQIQRTVSGKIFNKKETINIVTPKTLKNITVLDAVLTVQSQQVSGHLPKTLRKKVKKTILELYNFKLKDQMSAEMNDRLIKSYVDTACLKTLSKLPAPSIPSQPKPAEASPSLSTMSM